MKFDNLCKFMLNENEFEDSAELDQVSKTPVDKPVVSPQVTASDLSDPKVTALIKAFDSSLNGKSLTQDEKVAWAKRNIADNIAYEALLKIKPEADPNYSSNMNIELNDDDLGGEISNLGDNPSATQVETPQTDAYRQHKRSIDAMNEM